MLDGAGSVRVQRHGLSRAHETARPCSRPMLCPATRLRGPGDAENGEDWRHRLTRSSCEEGGLQDAGGGNRPRRTQRQELNVTDSDDPVFSQRISSP